MICRRCGTQSQEERCPYCGTVLWVQTAPEAVEEPPEVNAYVPPAPPVPVQNIPTVKKVSFFRVFLAAFALFLPLAYLFFDLFAKLSDVLLEAVENGTQLSSLVSKLFSFDYAANSFEEIKLATLGRDLSLLELYGAADIFSGTGELLLPLLLVVLLCVSCAVLGVLLLFGGKLLLQRRWMVDLVTVIGVGAVFSPLFGLLLLRVLALFDGGLCAADLQARAIMPTLETMLLLAILILLVMPAIALLRRAGAAQRGELKSLGVLCQFFGGRSFGFAKLMAALSLFGAVACGVLCLLFPIFVQGSIPSLTTSWRALSTDGGSFFLSLLELIRGEGSAVDLFGMMAMILDLLSLCIPVLTALLLFSVLLSFSRIRRAKRRVLCTKKAQCRSLSATGRRIHALAKMPYVLHLAAQGVLVFLLAMCSGLVLHLDFGAVSATTEQMYLLVGYVRMLCGVNTLYALFAVGCALLGSIAHQYCMKMIVLSQKHCEENQQKEV